MHRHLSARDSDSSSHGVDPNMVMTLIYFLTIGGVIIGTAIYFNVMARITDPEVLLIARINTQREVQHLIDNLASQFKNFRKLPLRWRSMRPYHTHHVLSWVFLVALVASVPVLIVALVLDLAQVVRISTFVYIVGLNALFMTRQHLYYVRRTHLTYDAEHYLVLDTLKFYNFDWCAFNIIQILLLVVEFVQLLSFPIRDMLRSINLASHPDEDSETANFIVGILTLFTNLSSKFYVIQFWFLVAVIGCMALAIAIIHTYNELRPTRPIALYWVKYLLPMANLFYLPMLVMLIGSASCLSKLGTSESASASSGLLRCDDPSISKSLYLSFTIVAYTAAYIILTTFVTSFDRIPIPGEIHFRSQGIAFLKNMSMLLSIDSLLVDNDHRHIRSIISVMIVVAMVCFNINTHPCFVEQINFWRSYSLCCILWVVLIVTMLTNENTILTRISVSGISAAIAVGAVVLFILFIIIWYFRQRKREEEEEKRSLVRGGSAAPIGSITRIVEPSATYARG